MSYHFIVDLAIILIATKLLGLVTKKLNMPQVVGALLAGVILGPACFGLLTETTFIEQTAELGVIVLMFCAGLETDISELKKCGKAAFVIALLGVVVPLGVGAGVAYMFNTQSDSDCSVLLQNIFVGVVLTATSVSITVETLKEMGKMQTKSGNAILGAAIIDDILGIIVLTIVTSMTDGSSEIGMVLLKIVLFFVVAIVGGYAFYKFYSWWVQKTKDDRHRYTIVAFAFCLILSYVAEEFFGVADITGAFIAGVIISTTSRTSYVASKFDVLSYLYLSPIFFASIGLKIVRPDLDWQIIVITLVLCIAAVLTKILGCGAGAKVCGYKNYQALRIGVGMVSRGEVALIMISKGTSLGLMNEKFVSPLIITVVLTTIITPILLKPVFNRETSGSKDDNNNSKDDAKKSEKNDEKVSDVKNDSKSDKKDNKKDDTKGTSKEKKAGKSSDKKHHDHDDKFEGEGVGKKYKEVLENRHS